MKKRYRSLSRKRPRVSSQQVSETAERRDAMENGNDEAASQPSSQPSSQPTSTQLSGSPVDVGTSQQVVQGVVPFQQMPAFFPGFAPVPVNPNAMQAVLANVAQLFGMVTLVSGKIFYGR